MGRKAKKEAFVKCPACGASIRKVHFYSHASKAHPNRVGEIVSKVEKELPELKELKKILSLISDEEKVNKYFIDNAKSLINEYGRDPEFWHALGSAYFSKEHFKKAKSSLQTALELRPRFKEALEGIKACDELLEDFRRTDWTEEDITALHEKLEWTDDWGIYKAANYYADRILKIDPEDKTALLTKGHILLMTGKAEAAKATILKILDMDPDCVEAKANLGQVHFRLHELDEAEMCYKEFLDVNPRFVPVLHNLGIIHFKKENYPRALEYLDEAVKNDPGYCMGWFSRFQILSTMGRDREAAKCLKKAEKLNPLYVTRMLAAQMDE